MRRTDRRAILIVVVVLGVLAFGALLDGGFSPATDTVERDTLGDSGIVRIGDWAIKGQKDQITDANRSWAFANLPGPGVLRVQCDDDGSATYFDFDSFMGIALIEVRWRLDQEAPEDFQYLDASDDSEAAFLPREQQAAFLQTLLMHDSLFVRGLREDGTERDFKVSLHGAKEALEELNCVPGLLD